MKILKNTILKLKNTKNSSKWSTKQQADFFINLSDLIISGYSLNQALYFLSNIHINSKQNIFRKINEEVEEGESLSSVLDGKISNNILFQIKIAEASGQLEQVLQSSGQYLDGQYQQLLKIKQVSRYPILLLLVLCFMAIAAKFFLYPIFEQWSNTNYDSWIIYLVIFIIILFVIILVVIYRYSKLESIKRLEKLSRLKVIGPVIKTIINYQIASNLFFAFQSGNTVGEVIDLYSDFRDNSVPWKMAYISKHLLEEGYNVNQIAESFNFVDDSLLALFNKGANQRQTVSDFEQYTKFAYKKIMRQMDNLINLVQPILFGVIGVAIVCMYLMMLLPMYQTIGGLYK